MTDDESDGHLDAHRVAAWADGTLPEEARATVEAHLAACAECRAEVADVRRLVWTAPSAHGVPRRVWVPAAAAAALALLWAGPRTLRDAGLPEHRQQGVATTVAPRPLAPVGEVDSVRALLWASVPRADRYRVRLFDEDGAVVWERESADTVVALPDTLALRPRRPYYWRVEAHTGFGRWVASDLIELVAGAGGAP